MIETVMKTCCCKTEEEAEELIDSEIEFARENFQADGDLSQAVDDCRSALGLDADYEMELAQLIAR